MPSNSNTISFLQHFESLEDPRIDRHKLHSLSDILLIMLCGSICGAESWRDFSDFGESKIDFLRKLTPLKNGIPSKNTLNRVFSSINPEHFKSCFNSWIRSIQRELGDVIAIDGKVLRGSFDTSSDKPAIHMVSAFSTASKLVLAQQKVDDKSNEITAIPKLLEMLVLKGAVVTIDAMGCQKAITKNIIDAGGDYAIAVKGNQKKLHEQIQAFFSNTFDIQQHKNVDVNITEEVSRNRVETRLCLATDNLEWLNGRELWSGIKSVVAIQSKRTINDVTSTEKRYYISSLKAESGNLNRIVRAHWGIENSLHWVLDVVFSEDGSRNRLGDVAENMAIMKHVALNQLQAAKVNYKKDMSISRLRKKSGWDDETLIGILQTVI